MSNLSNAGLASRVNDLIGRWDVREKQYADWQAGTATGGPYGDGRYPLTSSSGTVYYVKSPAALQAQVDGPTSTGGTQATAAAASATAAATSATAAATSATQVTTLKNQAVTAKDSAELAKSQAEAAASTATAASAAAVADAAELAQTVIDVEADRVAAEAAATAAAASAAAAATFNPASYSTHAQVDAKVAAIVDSSPATLNTLNELANALGDDPNFATTVATQIGTKYDKTGGVLSGRLTTAPNATGVMADAAGSRSYLEVIGPGGANAAFMTFHRSGVYAAYFGIDTDNKFKVGGWSLGANAYEVWHAGSNPATVLAWVGAASTDAPTFTNQLNSNGILRSTGYAGLVTTGVGVEVFWHTTNLEGNILAYDRTGSAYKPMNVNGQHVNLMSAGVTEMRVAAGVVSRKNANSATLTAQPRIFSGGTDPGAAAADGDWWAT